MAAAAAELAIKEMGISFTVYSEGANIDRAWPFDFIPRVITDREWSQLSRGLLQRMRALNCFIDDVYNGQKILADGVVPAEIVPESSNFLSSCAGVSPRLFSAHLQQRRGAPTPGPVLCRRTSARLALFT